MSDEAFFQSALDADADDPAARLLFADWLAERGDDREVGYRWMAALGRQPKRDRRRGLEALGVSWDWWSFRSYPGRDRPYLIAPELFEAMSGHEFVSDWDGDCAYREFESRSAAEVALCRVLAMGVRP